MSITAAIPTGPKLRGAKLRLPNSTQRTAIIGRTGSGKTQAAAWLLSRQSIDVMPWVIFDYKTDELLNSIDRAQHVDLDFVPSKAGVYIVHPTPGDDTETMLWKLWARENVGIYVDEGYMLGDHNAAFEACLTQGRSKHIPMIVLSQRPAWISRFVFSEADFFQVFHLNDKRDKKAVESFVPQNLAVTLPPFHSFFYDVGKNTLHRFAPVPNAVTILETFEHKLAPVQGPPRRKFL
jgi:DNA helicase HerA-like ATPase